MENNEVKCEGKCEHACGAKCGCMHHKMVPLMITLIGVAFLLQALNVLTASTVATVWPILLIVAGGTKMFSGSCKCC